MALVPLLLPFMVIGSFGLWIVTLFYSVIRWFLLRHTVVLKDINHVHVEWLKENISAVFYLADPPASQVRFIRAKDAVMFKLMFSE